jgi:hypothetical protein
MGGVAGGVVVLIVLGIVIWKLLHSGEKSEAVSEDKELDLIAEQTMLNDGIAEPANYVTEANVLTSDGKALTTNFLEDSDGHSDD